MAVTPMKAVTIAGHAADRDQVVARLHQLGVMQLAEVGGPDQGADPAPRSQVRAEAQARLAAADRRLAELTSCLTYLSRWDPVRKGLVESFLAARDRISPDDWERAGRFDPAPVWRACQRGEVRWAEVRAREAELTTLIQALRPLTALSGDLEGLADTELVAVFVGQGREAKVAALERELAASGAIHHLARLGAVAKQVYFVLLYPKDQAAAAEALRNSGLEAASLPEAATASEALQAAQAELAGLAAERVRLAAEGRELAGRRPDLQAAYDRCLLDRQQAEAQAMLGQTESTFVMRGWVPAKVAGRLEAALAAGGAAVAVDSRDPEPGEQPPVLLSNHPGAAPFEIVTNIYGWPSYREVDPTPVLAPFFALFFALALTDAGYGILLAAYCWWMMRKPSTPKGSHKFFRLMLIGGALTVVAGALTGGWFGDALDFLPEQARLLTRLKDAMMVIDPIQNPMPFMALSLVLGLLHLMTGIGVKAYMAVRDGRVLDAALDQGLWLVLLPSLGLVAAGPALGPGVAAAARIAALAAVTGLVLTQGRAAKSIVGKVFGGLYSLYGLIGYLSDTLSYTRLFALGLASTALGMAINEIALMLRPVPVVGLLLTLVIMAFGHLVSLLLNAFGAFIHSGRLQFVEFFTKFFDGGGKAFRPFAERPRFTQVTQD